VFGGVPKEHTDIGAGRYFVRWLTGVVHGDPNDKHDIRHQVQAYYMKESTETKHQIRDGRGDDAKGWRMWHL
jgi:hypothetical protein